MSNEAFLIYWFVAGSFFMGRDFIRILRDTGALDDHDAFYRGSYRVGTAFALRVLFWPSVLLFWLVEDLGRPRQ